MRADTERAVEGSWCQVFDIAPEALWQHVTVRPHGPLGDYHGWYVAWRESGVHVSAPSASAPSASDADEVASLTSAGVRELQDPAFWAAFARQRGLQVRGPAMHAYLDGDPGPDPGTVDLTPADLEPIRAEVTAEEWDDWHIDDPEHLVGLFDVGRVTAAAGLGAWGGTPRDLGVIVVPDHRGRGLAARVGRTCASYAVRDHGYATWRAALTNVASVRTAERLDFEPYATQLALRPPPG